MIFSNEVKPTFFYYLMRDFLKTNIVNKKNGLLVKQKKL